MSFYLPPEIADKTGRFHLVNPAELDYMYDWAKWLESILHNPCSIAEQGGRPILVETKQLVERLSGLRIEIYSDEHPPPHFHVKSPEVNASFAIEDCRIIHGIVPPKSFKKIKYWHSAAKGKLIEVWNSSRPTTCTVGQYRDA